jgi:hypothetical protein
METAGDYFMHESVSPNSEMTRDDGVVVFTRKRLDCYFLLATAIAGVLGLAFWLASSDKSPLFWPLSIVGLWLLLRFRFPDAGMAERAISARWLITFVAWIVFISTWFFGGIAVDRLVLGHGPEGFPNILWPLPIVVFVGSWLIAKQLGSSVSKNESLERELKRTRR